MLGVDIARNLVEAGNKRAAEQGLTNCRFQEGDATNLQELPDQTFDLVVSIFGAMFAPKPFDVAKEMVRVTRPGGRIVMGNWIPNDPTLVAQILKISSALYAAAAGGFRQPDDVGRREPRDRAVWRRRHSGETGSPSCETRSPSTIPAHRRRSWMIPELLRADHECVRGRGEERPSR